MLDINPELSLCPRGDADISGPAGADPAGPRRHAPVLRRFCYCIVKAEEGEDSLKLTYADKANGLTYVARFAIYGRTHVIEAQAPAGGGAARAPALAVRAGLSRHRSIVGRDDRRRRALVRRVSVEPHALGRRGYATARTAPGAPDHEHFPGLIIPCRGATNTQGHAYAFHYGWSGGHPDDCRGTARWPPPDPVGPRRPDGDARPQTRCCETAPLYMPSIPDDGLNGCAVSLSSVIARDRDREPGRNLRTPAPGALQLLGRRSISITRCLSSRTLPAALPIWGPNASCWMTAGSAAATTTPARFRTGRSTRANTPKDCTPLIDHVHAYRHEFRHLVRALR